MESINIAMKAVPARSTKPILMDIVFYANDDDVHLIANDGDLGIETILEAKVSETGAVAIPAKMLAESIKKMPEADITLSSPANKEKGYEVLLKCGKIRIRIPGEATDQFLFLPEVEREGSFTVKQKVLQDALDGTLFSLAKKQDNQLMTAEYMELSKESETSDNKVLRLIALDGHRISIRRVPVGAHDGDNKANVPGKTLNEVIKLLTGDDDETVTVSYGKNHVVFDLDGTTVVSNLVQGEFFAVDQMISSDYKAKVLIKRDKLIGMVDRATLFVEENDKKPIVMNFKGNNLNLSIESKLGAMSEDLDIDKTGEDIMIGFNPRFMLEALKNVAEDNVTFYLTGAKSPVYIRDEESTYFYLILPVNI